MKEWILIVVPIEPIIIIPHVLFHSSIPSKPKASVPATDPQELAPQPSHPVQAVADPDEDSSAEQLWPEAYTGISQGLYTLRTIRAAIWVYSCMDVGPNTGESHRT